MPQNCATCNACQPVRVKQPDGGSAVTAQCRALPPTVVATPEGPFSAQPEVNPITTWCRLWEPRDGYDDKGERIGAQAPTGPKLVVPN